MKPQTKLATSLCCLCGLAISSGESLCASCLARETDVTNEIPKQEHLTQCRECFRFKGVTRTWLQCEPESSDLLALCLKRFKGLGKKYTLIDSKFVWTEEHSKRIQVKVVIAPITNDKIHQTAVCEFVVTTQMCPDCQSDTVDQTWRSIVQLRQNVAHRRTLFFLEQQIIQKKLAEKASNVEEAAAGIDVYFNKHEQAVKFADACQALVPIGKRIESKKLTGQDAQNNSFKFRHTMLLEILPVCKHDLVILTKKNSTQVTDICLVDSIAHTIHLVNANGKRTMVNSKQFLVNPFKSVATAKDLVEFIVLDIVSRSEEDGEMEVASIKDFGVNNHRYFVRVFSGTIFKDLEAGESVLGYDLRQMDLEDNFDIDTKHLSVPPVIIVRKKPDEESKRKSKNKRKQNKKGAKPQPPSNGAEEEEDDDDYDNDQEEVPSIADEQNLV